MCVYLLKSNRVCLFSFVDIVVTLEEVRVLCLIVNTLNLDSVMVKAIFVTEKVGGTCEGLEWVW